MINTDQANGKKYRYIFDSLMHKNAEEMTSFLRCIGTIEYIIEPFVNDINTIYNRYKIINEIEEISEEQ